MKISKSRHPRIPYSDQEFVRQAVHKHLSNTEFYKPFVNSVFLFGSLADGEFGLYTSPKMSRGSGKPKLASDVDLIIIGDERFDIPENWRKNRDFIWEHYYLPTLSKIKGIRDGIHNVSALVYRPSLGDLPIANPNNYTGDVFGVAKTRKEALGYHFAFHDLKEWFVKREL